MNSQNEQKSFFDTRTIVAIVLVGVLFFGWQKYLEQKYPDFYKKKEAQKTEQTAPAKQEAAPNAAPAAPTTAVSAGAVVPETNVDMQIGDVSFSVSSKGMGLRNWTLHDYKNREQKPVQIGLSKDHGLYELVLAENDQPIHFALTKVSETSVKGTAQVGSMAVEQTLTYQVETKSLTATLVLRGAPSGFKGFSYLLPEEKQAQKDGTFFLPSMEHQEFVVRHQGSLDRVAASSQKEEVSKSFEHVSMFALGSQYFASAFLDKSEIIPEVSLKAPTQGELLAKVTYKPATVQESMSFQWIGYVGPKSMDQLQKIDPVLSEVVDFGWFAPIGKVLLVLLKWFYSFVGNWGVAIILLTLLVRAIVLPFNITSYKSMKRMQTIQPMLQSIRERYKDDPAAMNRETMALMREQKVNPLGGCLPMLLQMPVFFALYRVLGQSIELYQAPFIGWIHDLSLKDPFFVLPVLMGVTMFIQQKMTPTTMDPQQAKILQWMPIIFSVFTLSLPAGLTLYIFVSTLFGVIQQQLFMRDRKAALKPAAAGAK